MTIKLRGRNHSSVNWLWDCVQNKEMSQELGRTITNPERKQSMIPYHLSIYRLVNIKLKKKKSSSNETSIKEKADHTYDCERCGLTLRLIKSRWTRSPFNCWIKWKRFWKREGIRWTVHKLSISAKFCSYEIVCLWRIRKQRNFKTDKLCNMLFLVIVVHGELPYMSDFHKSWEL